MSTILTAAGESLIARLQAEGKALIIDTMILANVPGQDHTQPIAPGVSVPAEAQIALRYAIPPQYRAYVHPNQVVYSAMWGRDMGEVRSTGCPSLIRAFSMALLMDLMIFWAVPGSIAR